MSYEFIINKTSNTVISFVIAKITIVKFKELSTKVFFNYKV